MNKQTNKMYCSVCECHHKSYMFGSQQRRKPATVRVCKTPTPRKVFFSSHVISYTFASYSDHADYCEFGHSRYFAVEKQENMYDSD